MASSSALCLGKTSTACSVAVNLADNGKKVLLISTDPASNLQDVFNTELDGKGVPIDGVPGLMVVNLNPAEAAREYRESVIAPYRGKLPDSAIENMEEQLSGSCKRVIFTMGKGGVGKTTIAATIAVALAGKGVKVHLTSTDPADHLKYVVEDTENIKLSKIDEKQELLRYQNEVLSKARETMSEDDVAYVEEDLGSPCTQEIAVFRAFAEIVDKAGKSMPFID